MNAATPTTRLTEVSKHFKITEREAHAIVLRHGNFINTKLLCDIDGAVSITQDVFNEIMEADKRLLSTVFPEERIGANSFHHIPFDMLPRIYFLLSEKRIVYVGQSCAICNRIWTHQNDKDGKSKTVAKEFDEVSTFVVDRKEINIIESVNIRHYRPLYNVVILTNCEYLGKVLRYSFLN